MSCRTGPDQRPTQTGPTRTRPDRTIPFRSGPRSRVLDQLGLGTQSNGFASTKACNSADLKSSQDDGFQPLSDSRKKVDEDPSKRSECRDQKPDDNVNSTNNVNAASTNRVNVVSENINDNKEADMNNKDTTIQVSPVPTTRIQKDHPLDQVIGDLHLTTQTRNITQKGNSCIERSKVDRGYARRDSTIQVTRGLQVKQKQDGIFISQDKYVTEILKKYGFTKVKNASTLMETQNLLLKDEDGKEVDVYMYRLMIGSLMYLTSSRPDIMFAVCACARYQVNPKVAHLYVVKRIFRLKKDQEKDKIGSKPDKNGKRTYGMANRLLYHEGRNVHTRGRKSVPEMNSRKRKMERGYYSVFTLKKDQEKDKIRSKRDKNRKRGESGRSVKQLQKNHLESLERMPSCNSIVRAFASLGHDLGRQFWGLDFGIYIRCKCTDHISLSDYEAFYFDDDHIKEISSGSTTTHSDISLSEYDSFIFDLSNDQFPPTNRSDFTYEEFAMDSLTSYLHRIEDDHSSLLAYVVWIFLAYLAYPVIPPYLHSFGNEDTIFDPGIVINRFYSFKPGLSHRCGNFKKFNTHRSHLNESLMEMLFSTCFLMDQ
nr:uncharacterized mitochondrial protein AtMg00810-like [Tanacetum cinerariifolium]